MYASRAKYRPSFSSQGLGPKVSASVAYKRAFQKATFNKILGSSVLGSEYISKKNFLTRGHHAPDADFHFAAWQFCTYFYINASPQWNRINGGNWATIENLVRRLAGKLARDLKVYTGTYGVLSLNDTDGNQQEMHLVRGNILPIPEYNWKLVVDEETAEAIVLLVLNNPFVNPEEVVHLCENSCRENGWFHKSWNKTQNGAVFCCEYDRFEEAVGPLVSASLNVTGVLRGPN
ncbi:PREDICTED: uncharacterized protein LOC108566400 [Nicrophorus vespilloides]|uniref:Uncharacterized protein LOC108566400 n=1 Tax=Nicrophorus vespilloides TaxID=110193 RepID=A0ABM1N4K3_NICVS|nr:PREDICTED: uncharacterized protein LOC108566400 [Nicrophorus vespilloides]